MNLTPRQKEIMESMWDGLSTSEAAYKLKVSNKTIEYHRAILYEKFQVNNPVSLLRRALKMNLIKL